MSSSSHSDLDLAAHLSNGADNGRRQPGLDGTNTPKDLASRIKIVEIFTLHVLPRNGEWDYARSFLTNSDILDEDRREAFLQTLRDLQDISEREKIGQADLDVFEDTEEEMPPVFSASATAADGGDESQSQQTKNTFKHQRTSSELDYGIEKEHPNGAQPVPQEATNSTTSAGPQGNPLTSLPPKPMSSAAAPPRSSPLPSPRGRDQLSPPAQTPRRPTRKSKASDRNSLLAQARQLFLALSNLGRNMAGAISKNPTTLLRFFLFVLAFFIAFSQRQVREKARRIVDTSWQKIRGTVGMGVKVSYI